MLGHPLEAVERYHAFLSAGPAMAAGDFNNNVRWDKGKKATNHAHTVAGLERLGMASAYHVGRGELHGKESLATLYSRDRKPDGRKYTSIIASCPWNGVPTCGRLKSGNSMPGSAKGSVTTCRWWWM